MYSEKQKQLVTHVQKKVTELFASYPVASHGIEHISRVVAHA
mgnify:FL=1